MGFSDDRDRRAFSALSPDQKRLVAEKWGDIYTWYLCERTNTIAAALREGFSPQELAQQYKISAEAIAKCTPLK